MRGISFLSRPTADIIRNIGRIHRQEIRFILEPCGPTKFHLKQIYPATTRSGTIYTVSIGAAQLCTCGSREICAHILYVMMRYFGVPKDSELLYQRSLSDSEIDSLFERRYIQRARSHSHQHNQQASPSRSRSQNNNNHQNIQSNVSYTPVYHPPPQKVNRLKISEDDLCPICYDSLFDCPPEEVAWCSFGCGGNFHLKCVQEWICSQNADGKPGSCPLCRVQMDRPDNTKAPNQKEFDDFYKQQLLQKQKHEINEEISAVSLFHSKDSCEAQNNNNSATPQLNQTATNSNNNGSGSEGSYLAMLRREMEASSASRAQIQQQIENQEKNQHQSQCSCNNSNNNNNNNNDNNDNFHGSDDFSISELAAQINEIDEFLSAARAELNNEMNRLKEHQRKVQATIEAQIKAGARARSGLKDSRGRSVEPVLKVRVPMFDSATSNITSQVTQQPVQRRQPQSIAPQPLHRVSIHSQEPNSSQQQAKPRIQDSMTATSNDHQNQATRPTRVVVTASPVAAQRIVQKESGQNARLRGSASESQVTSLHQVNDFNDTNTSLVAEGPVPITEDGEIMQNSPNSATQSSQPSVNSQRLQSPPRSPPQPPPQPSIARPSIAPSSISFLNSPSHISPLQQQQQQQAAPSVSCSSSLSSLSPVQHFSSSLNSSSSLSSVPPSSPPPPPEHSPLVSIKERSDEEEKKDANGTDIEAMKINQQQQKQQLQLQQQQPKQKQQSRLASLIDDYCSLESYEEEPTNQSAAPSVFTTTLAHHQPQIRPILQHSQTREVHSSFNFEPVSNKKQNEKNSEHKKPEVMKPAKTVNLNDVFNDLTAPRGNITDGLTLAHQQARENEQRLQRTLSPSLAPKGLIAKRAAKSRLQPKRTQNSQAQQQSKRKARLGWSS